MDAEVHINNDDLYQSSASEGIQVVNESVYADVNEDDVVSARCLFFAKVLSRDLVLLFLRQNLRFLKKMEPTLVGLKPAHARLFMACLVFGFDQVPSSYILPLTLLLGRHCTAGTRTRCTSCDRQWCRAIR
jgi:hypothetical protein